MLQSLGNSVYNIGYWCSGANNLTAMKEVVKDRYHYNDADANGLTKCKQISTEVVHMFTKWATLTALFEKVFYKEPYFAELSPIKVNIPTDLATAISYIPTFLGTISFIYSGYISVKDLVKAWDSAKKALPKDIDGNRNLAFNHVWSVIEKSSTSLLTYHFMYNYWNDWGFKAAIIPGALIYATEFNNELINDRMTPNAQLINMGFKAGKLGLIVHAAGNSPVAPIVRGITTLFVKALNWAATTYGV